MARLKTSSKSYEQSFRRIAAVKSIDPSFDLGNGLTASRYQAAIDEVKNAMDTYNTTLSTVDDLLNNLKEKEKALMEWNERVLIGVAAKFGKNSTQYEQAGGKRKSERKKPSKKPS